MDVVEVKRVFQVGNRLLAKVHLAEMDASYGRLKEILTNQSGTKL